MKNKILSVNNLSKSIQSQNDNLEIINNLSFTVYEGEFISIVGTSGCGKTTLLNILGNVEKNYSGSLKYHIDTSDIGYMLQEPALFPWLTIKDNANIALKIKNLNNYELTNKLLREYGLEIFLNKYPQNLSGGMRQRVALIRTMSLKPKLLLLDEPFAALDYQSRLKIGNDLKRITKKNNITTIMITHDISEALSLSSKIIVLSKRPCYIKKIYELDFLNDLSPFERRNTDVFNKYFENICEDLELFEK